MKNFAIGCLGLVAGAALWIAASVVGGLTTFDDGEADPIWYVPMIVGFVVMIATPIGFWLVIPIWRRTRRQRPDEANK